MRPNIERLAWTVLLGSLACWVLLAVSVPLGVRWWLLNAASDQVITNASSGTVLVRRPGRSSSEANLVDIPVGSTIVTQADTQASLTFSARDTHEVLATITVYGNTELSVSAANTPRFRMGMRPNQVEIALVAGRIRVQVAGSTNRPVVVRVRSPLSAATEVRAPDSNVAIQAAPAQSVVTVREGEALVMAAGEGITVRRDERAEVAGGQPPSGPLPAERNLIVNGDFSDALEAAWVKQVRQPQDPNEEWGTAEVITASGRRAVTLRRAGQAWGEVGIVQDINVDVRDFRSLRLQLDVLIQAQDLYNCGQQGTECPVMVRITYLDAAGGTREWLRGFYYNHSNAADIPRGCPSCAPPVAEHVRLARGQWNTFESGNLLESLGVDGLPAATIKSLAIYASGHIFDSLVADVQLLATE